MSYGLGVDLGTTFTAAAVARDGRVAMATLGDHTDAVPSVVLIRADGTVLTGGAAERRAAGDAPRKQRPANKLGRVEGLGAPPIGCVWRTHKQATYIESGCNTTRPGLSCPDTRHDKEQPGVEDAEDMR